MRKQISDKYFETLIKQGVSEKEIGIRHIARNGIFLWNFEIFAKGKRKKEIKQILKQLHYETVEG